MSRTSKGEGAGGNLTNLTGKGFERDVFDYLKDKIEKIYDVESYRGKIKLSKTQKFFKIYDGAETIGAIGTQSSLFTYLGKPEYLSEWSNINKVPEAIKDVWEKNLIPDVFIINFRNPEKFITFFEVKYQNDSGSVDEKLQTGKYKKNMWNKLFRNLIDNDSKVEYAYLLSHWFGQKSKKKSTDRDFYYQDTFDYLDEIKIQYWINNNIDYQDKVDDDGEIVYKKNSSKPASMYLSKQVDFPGFDIKEFFKTNT